MGVLSAIEALQTRERIIARRRTFAHPAATLSDLGGIWNLTRERVRQLESRWVREFHAINPVALDAALLGLRRGRRVPLYVHDLLALDPWFEGVDQHVGILAGALRSFGCQHRLVDSRAGPYVTDRAAEDTQTLVKECREILKEEGRGTCDVAHRQQLVASLLRKRGVAELLPVVLNALVQLGAGVLTPTQTEQVEELLRKARRPMSFAEILTAMQPITAKRLHTVLLRADAVRGSRGVYVLRGTLGEWARLLPSVRTDVVDFLGCEPEKQWRSADLLVAIAEAGAEWAARLPQSAFEQLLHEIPEVRNLRRSVWGLADVHADRLRILDLAIAVLREAGEPVRTRDLLERVRSRRAVNQNWRGRYPVVALGHGMVGLAGRDLGIDDAAWGAWCSAIKAKLQVGEGVDTRNLAALLVEVGGPAVDNDVMKRLLAGEQTLSRRVGDQSR